MTIPNLLKIVDQIQHLWQNGDVQRELKKGWVNLASVLKVDGYYGVDGKTATLTNLGISWLNGMIAFRSSLALSCIVLKMMRISSANNVLLAGPCGLVAVALSSVVAGEAFMLTTRQFALSFQQRDPPFKQFELFNKSSDQNIPSFLDPTVQGIFVMVSGALVFYLLGGRARRVAPSDVWKRGSFAKSSLPAPVGTDSYAYTSQRHKLQEFGRKHGCHHCGYRTVFIKKIFGGYKSVYIGDHIPPNKFENNHARQRLYPQCKACCVKQSTSVRTEKRQLILHRGHRLYHLWMPLPLLWIMLEPLYLLLESSIGF